MRGRKGETMAVTKQKQASQPASCYQTVCCSHPLSGFHRRRQADQRRSAQAVGLRMFRREPFKGSAWSGDTRSMGLPGLFKCRGLIRFLRLPDGVEHACPDIGQGSDRDAMAFALSPFPLVVLFGPGFLVSALPGKLVQSIAPGLDAAQASMRFLVRPTLEEDRRGASESLQTARALITLPIIPEFSQQARSETCPSSGQGLEEFEVLMDQKKALNLLVIVSNLLHHGFELIEQCYHQARFGANRHLGGVQARLLELRGDLLGSPLRSWIPGLLQQSCQIFHRGQASRLQGGIGTQEFQRRGLLQLAEQVQSHGIVGYASGGELIDQSGLHLHQAILVAGQRFEFLDLFTVRVEPVQILEVGAPGFRQQIGVNAIRLGPRRGASPFDGSGIDRIDGPSLLQQVRDQQSVGRFNNTGDLVFSSWACHPLQIGVQLAQSVWTMSDSDRPQLMALFVDAQRIMMVVGPINAAKLHDMAPSPRKATFPNSCVLILWRSKRDSLMTSPVQKRCQGRTSFLNRSSRVERRAFPRPVRQSIRASVLLAPAPCRGGLVQY